MKITKMSMFNVSATYDSDFDRICWEKYSKDIINIVTKYQYETSDKVTYKKMENDLNGFIKMKKITHLDDKLFEL
jgi:hypothetical protein